MKAVIQRVNNAGVSIGGDTIAEIGAGYAVLVGIAAGDGDKDVAYIADKIAGLRLFPSIAEKEAQANKAFNMSIRETGGEVLVVSQFTLLGECRSGRRPDWGNAAPAGQAEKLYKAVVEKLRNRGLDVKEGVFRANMAVRLENDGPVTIILDSRSG